MSSFLENLRQDLHFAFRNLRKSPGFLAVVILSLALGIGATSTIFSVIDAALFRPLAAVHPEQLVVIWETEPGRPDSRQYPPIAELNDWRAANHSFQDIALTSGGIEPSMMSGVGTTQLIQTQNITPNYFSLIGMKPQLGRVFFPEEAQDKSMSVVLSDNFWRTKFAADPKIVGKTFDIQGSVATVVGVMPRGLGAIGGEKVDLWLPIDPKSARYADRIDHWLLSIGRMKPGVTIDQAQAEMTVIAKGLEVAYPKTNKGVGAHVQDLQTVTAFTATYIYPLFGAVVAILLIGCLNVANLLQSRTESRRREYALRLALGAKRSRLVQQTLLESGVLAAFGCVAGIALTFAGVSIFISLVQDYYLSTRIHIDIRVLAFAVVISAATALLFGLIPAWQASRTDPNGALRDSERGAVGKTRGLVRKSLAVAEIALAMVLLVGAGLMIDSILQLKKVNPGFDSHNVMTAEINLPEGGKYIEQMPRDMEKMSPNIDDFYSRLIEKYSGIPGVEAVTVAGVQPGATNRGLTFSIAGLPAPDEANRPRAGFSEARPGFFEMFRIPLRKGRLINEHDVAAAPWVVVVNESFAKKFFPNEDPIGKQIRMRFDPYPIEEDRPRQIVGVAADVKNVSLSYPTRPYMYVSSLQHQVILPGGVVGPHKDQTVMLKLKNGDKSLESQVVAAMRSGIEEVDPNALMLEPITLDDLLDLFIGDFFFYRNMLGLFAGIALFLAVIGIYGVMSYFVTARTHEIGVRVALGALPRDVIELIGGLGLKLSLLGVIIGTGLALALTRVLTTFLYGVKPTDPLTYTVVAITLIAVALLACFIPARRAIKVDPMVALRHE
ncbi:MAG TPA: ABC transporter permease [Candidatus Acidoferrum sp.]|jgi:putative ABC transport system permease protein